MANILVIDDDISICKMMVFSLKRKNHDIDYALTLKEGLKRVSSGSYEIIFLDVNLPDGNGLEALPDITASPLAPEVIIITGEGDADGAELAIKSGAWTYIQKPPAMNDIMLQLERVLGYRNEKAKRKPPVCLRREEIVGNSPQVESCLEQVAQAADSNVNVLLTGETGTGKELFAKAIHNNSSKSERNFVIVDCASLPETLAESVLFGHKKGAFTGAQKDRSGLIREADGGTLFLDEIGELPLSLQKDFLRVLQEYRLRPLGSDREVKSNFRLICATNRDLNEMVKKGQFRKDLLFRINVFLISLPPLRSRTRDIKKLSIHFVNNLCERDGIETKGFSSDFFDVLQEYNWPGNIRELLHTMEQVLTVGRFDPILYPRHLPTTIRVHHARASLKKVGEVPAKKELNIHRPTSLPTLKEFRESAILNAEKQYLAELMMQTNGNMKKASEISGVSQSRLYFLMNKNEIMRS